jgi:hypothetical protein
MVIVLDSQGFSNDAEIPGLEDERDKSAAISGFGSRSTLTADL